MPPDDLPVWVFECFTGIQGEGLRQGAPCSFVRLSGCDVRCDWCDTQRAWELHAGRPRTVGELVAWVAGQGLPLVCVTGGEPLNQPGALDLLVALADARHTVLLETSGTCPIAPVDPRVRLILDLKPPSAGPEVHRRARLEDLRLLRPLDELKIVVADRADYEWARGELDRQQLWGRVAAVHFSPAHGRLAPAELAAWLVADRSRGRLMLQLHKLIGVR